MIGSSGGFLTRINSDQVGLSQINSDLVRWQYVKALDNRMGIVRGPIDTDDGPGSDFGRDLVIGAEAAELAAGNH